MLQITNICLSGTAALCDQCFPVSSIAYAQTRVTLGHNFKYDRTIMVYLTNESKNMLSTKYLFGINFLLHIIYKNTGQSKSTNNA